MNKEQQIKDIKKCIGKGFSDLICGAEDFEVIYECIQDGAEALYNAGYRNQKKAVEEFLQELKSELSSMTGMFTDELGFALSLDAVIRMIDGMFERKYNQDD